MTGRSVIAIPAQAASVTAEALRHLAHVYTYGARTSLPGSRIVLMTEVAVCKTLAQAIEAQVNP